MYLNRFIHEIFLYFYDCILVNIEYEKLLEIKENNVIVLGFTFIYIIAYVVCIITYNDFLFTKVSFKNSN